MMIKGLRYLLIMGLVVAISWMGAGVFLDTKTQAAYPFPNASLCIHRP